MKIYLAGPMRGYQDFNHPAFHKAAAMLRGAGHEVFCPAEQDVKAGFDATGTSGDPAEIDAAGVSLRKLLGADLAWICDTSDALVMLPGWEDSPGARAEASTALALGIPVWEFGRLMLNDSRAAQVTTVPGEASMSGIVVGEIVFGSLACLVVTAAFVAVLVLRKKDYTISWTLLSVRVSPPSPAALARAARKPVPSADDVPPADGAVPLARRATP